MAKCIPPDEIQLVMDLLIPGWVRISGLSCLFRRIGSTANSLRIDIYHTLACTPGPIDKRAVCDTCGSDLANCAGHWGCIRLALPVFHIGFFKTTVQILQMICKTCSRILILEPERSQLLQRVRRPKITSESHVRNAMLKRIWTKAKKNSICPWCGAVQGPVKRVGVLKIVHYPHNVKLSRIHQHRKLELQDFSAVISKNPEIERHLGKAADDLTPIRVLRLFQQVPDDDVELLLMNPKVGRPEKLLMTILAVPPVCIRPSVCADPTVGSTEDDLTILFSQIANTNNGIKEALSRGNPVEQIFELWEFIQVLCARFINSDLPGVPPSVTGTKPVRGLSQRLKGKTGRFRGNLSGKRVDFTSRTVISPDPNLRIDEVGVPIRVARTLTYPERVTSHNIERLRKMILKGPDDYPGANFIEFPDKSKRYLKYGDRHKYAQEIGAGCIVERHLVDGDIVLFNRQPSLHKNSIMSHSVKVVPWRTFRFNECVCAPYNADFDGDEMNLHVPQTEEARAEASELLCTLRNIVTARNGEPLIAATQDFLTASYLITRKDRFFDRAEACRILSFLMDAEEYVVLPEPAIIKPIELWTGKQIYSCLLLSAVGFDRERLRGFTLECAEKSFSLQSIKSDSYAPHLCPDDGWVAIDNGDIISGQLGKSSLGSGSKKSILYCLMRECGNEVAASAMNRIAKFSARWHSDAGFSIGLDDVTPSDQLTRRKMEIVQAGYEKCEEIIGLLEKGKLQPRPGCNQEQTMEALVNHELSGIREKGGKACINEIDPKANAALAMALCGSKGSNINISQMVACVGQQTVGGKRPPNGFFGRALPHFEGGLKAQTPAAKGFVQNSFFSGLTSTEFFFHTMGGREGLVDTAVKTAQTGYMQRRLMKALEDLGVMYDSTVRASDGSVVQFTYGDDGLDPAEMESEFDGRPLNFDRSFSDGKAFNRGSTERILTPEQLVDLADNIPERPDILKMNLPLVVRDLVSTIKKSAQKHKAAREKRDLMSFKTDEDRVAWLETVDEAYGIRRNQVERLVASMKNKVLKSSIEPGTTVGAIGATSIGEPATQMTLKTFHFAGVASMNITLGVPRITEIINASKSISTPIITAPLVNDKDVLTARIVKGRIERTTLGQVAKYVRVVYRGGDVYISIKLNTEVISKLHLEVIIGKVRTSIIRTLKAKEADVTVMSKDKIHVRPSPHMKGSLFYQIINLLSRLPNVDVEGLPGARRAVINDVNEGAGTPKYNLLVEGDCMLRVMTIPGVRGEETTCNHVAAVEKTLGIEAARKTIMNEIVYTMESHGMSIDVRHVTLLADVMSFRGEVLGIQRFGIIKMKTSTLMLASFETAVDHLFDAAVHSRKDDVVSVSECIILGVPIPLGTGLFKLMRSASRTPVPAQRQFLLRDTFKPIV
uniref:DNA-directed RNA polymerase subunit n=1 Tax=Rhodosorus marinus TaxID=101924 RepID=A0A7S2ZF96_9RHOD|mmetsp:Transcript_1743/g.6501  ORF Transcript_1743/g.6501 Transcript_1743/m.6501 type:complete len:1401 (+) Transcript_1743:2833-7035(+)